MQGQVDGGRRCGVEIYDFADEERLCAGVLINLGFSQLLDPAVELYRDEYILRFDAEHRWSVGMRPAADAPPRQMVIEHAKPPDWLNNIC